MQFWTKVFEFVGLPPHWLKLGHVSCIFYVCLFLQMVPVALYCVPAMSGGDCSGSGEQAPADASGAVSAPGAPPPAAEPGPPPEGSPPRSPRQAGIAYKVAFDEPE